MALRHQARATASSSSAAHASSPPPPLPQTPPLPRVQQSSPAHTLRYAGNDYPEPPSTPPNKHRRPVNRSRRADGGAAGKESLRSRASTNGSTPRRLRETEGEQEQEEAVIIARGDATRHSHGLSWTSNTRDSLVDNLLMSLDGLSQLANHNLDDIVRERERDAQWHRHETLNAMSHTRSRPRGHTYSSSASSVAKPLPVAPDSPASALSTPPPGHSRRSVSSSNFSNAIGKGRMRKSSVADSTKSQTHVHGSVRHTRGYSNASSADNGYATALETPKLNWGGVRSMSMDQIHHSASAQLTNDSVLSRGRPVPSVYSRYESSFDAAPEPMVPAGPRKMQNPHATGPVYVGQAPKSASALRKITTQSDLRAVSSSAVPQDVRDRATSFIRASSMRDTAMLAQSAERSLPAAPASTVRKDASSPHRERPGFFKRVFGGAGKASNDRPDALQHQSSTTSRQSERQSSAQDVTAAAKPDSRQLSSPDHPAQPTQPQLSKKPSSFFRRRKKSTSDTVPPPPVPASADAAGQPRASVSSLRKVMDQYLTERPANASDARSDISRPMTRASVASDDLDIFHSGYTPPADAALNKSKVTLGSVENDSPRLKVNMRQQNATEPLPSSASQSRPSDGSTVPVDSVLRNGSALSAVKTLHDPRIEQPQVSPLSDVAPDVLSTALDTRPNKLLPPQDLVSPEDSSQEMRDFAAGNNVNLDMDSESWLGAHDRPALDEATLEAMSPGLDETAVPGEDPDLTREYRDRAQRIFDGDEKDIGAMEASSWLGETKTVNARTLHEYMQLYDFAGMNIVTALRRLCDRLVLRGETQQFDRIITALSSRWCESNPRHGFKAQDVVHTLCYSVILLNTDLHLADIGEKMSRNAYVKNTLPTIRRVVADAEPNDLDEGAKAIARPTVPWMDASAPSSPIFPPDTPRERVSFDSARPVVSKRNSIRPGPSRAEADGPNVDIIGSNALINAPFIGPMRAWEAELENILKTFFNSIRNEPLPLMGISNQTPSNSANPLSANTYSTLKRTGSVVSRAPSETGTSRSRGLRSLTLGFQGRNNRSRQKVFMGTSSMATSRTSFDDSNSVWSPTQSSTWSGRNSTMGKTLTSSSMNSLAASYMGVGGGADREFKHSIGFANALSHAIIREEGGGIVGGTDIDSFTVRGDLLEDESLTLEGAPWAKEGMLKHKHHLEGPERKAKERSWNECFAVISRGKLTLFNFNTTVKTRSLGRPRTKQGTQSQPASIAQSRVGGGDWMENAEQLGVFVLRHTISTTLPPPGYSKTRAFVWALSLPSGAVHLFHVGTPEIAQEWMTTANYWSARLSKEPLQGGVSNIEYGWSDNVINTAVLEKSASASAALGSPPPSVLNKPHGHGHSASNGTVPRTRQSINSSIRGSFDMGSGPSRQRLPGDKVQITEWTPPSQSVMASQLPEAEQMKSLANYVVNVELDLEKHHEVKHAIELAFSPRHANYGKVMTNWQRKSEYLLREAVKFRTYIDSLNAAQVSKDKVYSRRAERAGKSAPAPMVSPVPAATSTTLSPSASSKDLRRSVSVVSASTVSLHVGDI